MVWTGYPTKTCARLLKQRRGKVAHSQCFTRSILIVNRRGNSNAAKLEGGLGAVPRASREGSARQSAMSANDRLGTGGAQ